MYELDQMVISNCFIINQTIHQYMYDDIIDNYRSSFHFPMFSILVKEDELIPQLFTFKFDGILNVLKGQSLLRTTLILMKDRIYIKLWDISLY